MNMSSNAEFDTVFTVPVMALEYRDLAGASIFEGMARHGARSADAAAKPRAEVELSKEEFAERIQRERAEAALHTEQDRKSNV